VKYDNQNCEIIWEKDVARFAIASGVRDKTFPGYLCLSNSIPWENLEILGNIYENPELVKENP